MRTRRNIPGMMVGFPRLVNEMLNEDVTKGFSEFVSEFSKPAVNIIENDEAYKVELMVPGFEKGDFKIEVKDNQLEISAEVKKEEKDDSAKYSVREFRSKSFKRIFSLPKEKADEENVNATYKNGILEITIAKKEEAKPKAPRMVEIA